MSHSSAQLVLRGRSVDAGGQVLPSLPVEVFDFDVGRSAQVLGWGTKDSTGHCELRVGRWTAVGRGEGAPTPFLLVHSADGGRLLARMDWVRMTELNTTSGRSPCTQETPARAEVHLLPRWRT